MKKTPSELTIDDNRMKSYLQKIATGPKMSKDLTEMEAEDVLDLILKKKVSKVQSAVFLIAARMKLETLDENIGYWNDEIEDFEKDYCKLPIPSMVSTEFHILVFTPSQCLLL